MKKLLILAIGLGVFLTQVSFAEANYGYVDMQQAVEMSKSGKKAIDKLKKIQEKKQKELDAKKNSLEKEQKDLQKKFAVYSQEKKMQVQQEFQKKAMEADQYFRDSQVELAKQEKELLEPVYKGLRQAIEKYAKKNNYEMIFEKNRSSVLYGADKADLTKEVVKVYGK